MAAPSAPLTAPDLWSMLVKALTPGAAALWVGDLAHAQATNDWTFPTWNAFVKGASPVPAAAAAAPTPPAVPTNFLAGVNPVPGAMGLSVTLPATSAQPAQAIISGQVF